MNVIKPKNASWFKRGWYSLIGHAKKVQLIGMTGSGKTTILCTISEKRDINPKSVQLNTAGIEKYVLDYETKNKQHFLIKSCDIAGRPDIYERSDFEKILDNSKYIVFCLNANFYLRMHNGISLSEMDEQKFTNPQEIYDTINDWLAALNKHITKGNNKQKMVIIVTHVDEYLKLIKKPFNKSYREMVLDELSKSILKNYNAYWRYAIDATQYKQVQEVFDSFLKN